MPPPITLPSVVRSGRTPYTAWAPPGATRNPVITLVEDEHRSVLVAALAQRLQEARHRRHAVHVPGDGLHDHPGDPVAELRERVAHAAGVVEGEGQRVLGERGGDAGREVGTPNVSAPEPAFTSSESPCPW